MKEKDQIISRMRNLIGIITINFFLIICVSSCSQKEVYYQYEELKNGKWNQSTECVFYIDSVTYDSLQSYDILLEVVHSTSYKYQDLWVSYSIEADSDTVKNDKKEKRFLLSDADGNWYGSGFGSLYQISLSLEKSIFFKKGEPRRNLQIRVSHLMTDNPLQGIEKVGIRIEKTQIGS